MGFLKSLKSFFGFGKTDSEELNSEVDYNPKSEATEIVEESTKVEEVTVEDVVPSDAQTTVKEIKSNSRKNKPQEAVETKSKPKRPRRKPKPKSE